MYLQDYIGNTPLVTLQHLGSPERGNRVMVKLEGNNPAGSVKDRPALHMIDRAEARGEIRPGDTLIEATSGNTGIALAMAAAVKGYRMILVMPENMSLERRAVMKAYGAELILVSREESMMGARDLAERMAREGRGWLVDQFSNPDNPEAHYQGTAPEIWSQSEGGITHFISAMGTTGTIVGCSRYFKEVRPEIETIGVHPAEGATIPGIRRWPEAYLPKIYDPTHIDRVLDVSQQEAEQTTRELASREGIFCGISSGGAVAVALRLARELEQATLVAIIADRGDRYLSTGVFPAE
jgi:cysteine synthase B